MKEPKLTIALAERGDQPVLLISRNDNDMFNHADSKLARLDEMGRLGAREWIGNMTLLMLQRAHSQAFTPYPALEPESRLAEPYDAVHYLLRMSMKDRTRRYVEAIDALVALHTEELSHTSWPAQWPYYRDRILRDYPD